MEEFIKGLREIKKKPEVILLLLIIFLIGGFIEFTYGSVHIGVVFFCVCLVLLFILTGKKSAGKTRTFKSPILIAMGAVLIVATLSYNYLSGNPIQTLDSMVLLLGASLILANSNNGQLAELGAFSFYMSLFFLGFFISLYIIPSRLNIDIPLYYGHYFVALPVYGLLKMFGMDLELPAKGLIAVNGVEMTTLKMDLACYGWYSMFLIVSTLLAYTIVIEKYEKHKLLKLILAMVGASYAANFLRVLILVVLTFYYGVDTMMLVHSHLGWVLFTLILLPLLYVFLNAESEIQEEIEK